MSAAPAAPAIDPGVAKRHGLAPRATAWPTVALCGGALAVQLVATWGAARGLVPSALAVALNAVCAYLQFTVAHDAAHRAASRIGWLNELLGHVAVLVLFAPFAAFRRLHLHHHAHTNDPAEDPDFWVVGGSWPSTLLRFATTWTHYYRVYFGRLVAWDGVLLQAAGGVAVLLAAAGLAWRTGHLGHLLLYWFLPAQLAVTLLAFLFDYLPHRPHTERGRLRDTASIVWAGGAVGSRLLDASFLNQNLHSLHHLFPTIPWYRYRAAYDEIEPGIRAGGGPVRSLGEAGRLLRPSLSRGLRWGRALRS